MTNYFILLLLFLSSNLIAQEVCDNGRDDDGNGLIDCVDPACICNICSNQEASIWYFGNHAGLDFKTGSPVVLHDSEMNTSEGCAVIADANGNLLFYSDGIKVWNRAHQIMPNGTGLKGNVSSTQSVLIVPHPSNFSLYYIFTVDAADLVGVADGFRYSIVDLSLDNGLGEVTTKNELLLANTTEKVAAIKHCNNTNIWIVAHEWNSANFHVYEISKDGLNPIPTIQNIGSVHDGGSLGTGNMAGALAFSIDGQRLACAVRDTSMYEIFDFDTYTGMLSNPISLRDTAWGWTYGVAFSPDGNVLYGSTLLNSGKVLQFDLSSGNASTIQASRQIITTKSGLGALQLGPDHKIYIANYNSEKIDLIHAPNLLGSNCQYQDAAIDLAPGQSILGLPNTLASYYYNELPVCQEGNNFDPCQGALFIPDAFTPNNDGVNDYFRPAELNERYIRVFKIYNRWGQEVYNNSSEKGWDGNFNQVAQPRGVYLYLLQTHLPGHEPRIRRGKITLLR